jgi:hypothetical protein
MLSANFAQNMKGFVPLYYGKNADATLEMKNPHNTDQVLVISFKVFKID